VGRCRLLSYVGRCRLLSYVGWCRLLSYETRCVIVITYFQNKARFVIIIQHRRDKLGSNIPVVLVKSQN
jgi:hypothetical protein